ncbi:MAG: exodeoxyribonuclease VII small subunit [Desulfuromonadales bacterium]|nr:exodeoxyribonuclease VII small subunit [Desulfuromonadales bacterium]MBN2793394.1 exodeoxyribonuclease VII small subunit [Desulfuromonadales bacterium]
MATMKNFETALKKLEETVEQLESGDLPLEQALKVFSTGVKQAEICRESLKDAELKVQQLLRQDDGSFQRDTFDDI